MIRSGRYLDSVELLEVPLGVPHGRAAGVERQDLRIEAGEPGLPLPDQLRLKAAVAIARHLDGNVAAEGTLTATRMAAWTASMKREPQPGRSSSSRRAATLSSARA